MRETLTSSKKRLHRLEYLCECSGRPRTTPVLQGQTPNYAGHTSLRVVRHAEFLPVGILNPVHELGLVQQTLQETESVAKATGKIWHALLSPSWHLRPRA